jgi:hypothetical protein
VQIAIHSGNLKYVKRSYTSVLASLLFICLPNAAAASAESTCAPGVCDRQELRTLKDLPPEVLSFLLNDPHSPKGIADRNGQFNVTDVVNSSLPMRRFVLAAMTSNRLVVEVERGGRSHYFEEFEFHLLDRHWVYVSHRNMIERVDDISSLLR